MPRIVLASASASRRRLLESAGVKPKIMVSHVDEESDFFNAMKPADMVIALAITKAHTIREQIDFPAIIIGCDSTFEFDSQSLGKPATPEIAIERASRVRGNSGLLHTGHCIIDTTKDKEISSIVTTKVTFDNMTDAEIDASFAKAAASGDEEPEMGDFEKAIEILRKKGQKVAANRADRDSSEGAAIAKVSTDKTAGVVISLNCETDFVAKNDSFVALANALADLAINFKSKEAFLV